MPPLNNANQISIARCRVSDDGLLQPYDYTPYFYFLMVFQMHTCPAQAVQVQEVILYQILRSIYSEKLKHPIIKIL